VHLKIDIVGDVHGHYDALVELGRVLGSQAPSGVHVLENDEVVIGSVRFLGCTLWTDFEITGDSDRARAAAVSVMNDYVRIRSAEFGFKRLRPAHTYRKHLESRAWLESKLDESFDGPTVVVTHHAPSIASVPEHERVDPIAACYASALDDLVSRSGAAFWVHGHTHRNVDDTLGRTRVLTNQCGYSDEPVAGFDHTGRLFELALR
jgi:hypothetical protein